MFVLPTFNLGVVGSPTVPPFTNSNSVKLDGSNDYVDISGVSSSLNSASAFTISLWYKTSQTSKGLIGGGTSSSNAFWIFRTSTSRLLFNVRNGASTYLIANGSNPNNAWNHVVAIANGSSSSVYINGSQVVTGTLPSLSSTGANNTAIGYIPPLGYNINAYIDEVGIWDSALSASDVAALRDTSGSNPVPTDISSLSPIGWWRMGDGSDGSGNNDGTVVGGLPQIYNVATDGSGNRITGIDGSMTNITSPDGIVADVPS